MVLTTGRDVYGVPPLYQRNPDWTYPPLEAGARDSARRLVKWSLEENEGKLPTRVVCASCPDPETHSVHYGVLQHFREAKRGARIDQLAYSSAWAILTEAFPLWAPEPPGQYSGCTSIAPLYFQLHFSEDFHTLSSSPFVNTLSMYFLFREQAGGGIPTDDEENGVCKVYPLCAW
jgi:hypothetical protein